MRNSVMAPLVTYYSPPSSRFEILSYVPIVWQLLRVHPSLTWERTCDVRS